MAKLNLNEQNDKLHRGGVSKMYNSQKVSTAISNALKNEETKEALNDFIFGSSDVNPLAEIRKTALQE